MTITITDPDFKITTRPDGVIEYSHPQATTVITSDYKVYNAKNGRELRVYQNDKLAGGQISSNFKNKRSNYSFARLLALMAGNPEKGYYRIIDASKPLTLDNITTLQDYMSNIAHKDPEIKQEPIIKAIPSDPKDKYGEEFNIVINKEDLITYMLDYVPCEENIQFITEDGLIFTERTKALMHQLNIDKGKELANIVLKDKGGWVLAEKMYLSQVSYRDGKPLDYNFKSVLENNVGIREVGDTKYLVESGAEGVKEFDTREGLERWLKAKALVDMVVDYRYNVSRVAEMIH